MRKVTKLLAFVTVIALSVSAFSFNVCADNYYSKSYVADDFDYNPGVNVMAGQSNNTSQIHYGQTTENFEFNGYASRKRFFNDNENSADPIKSHLYEHNGYLYRVEAVYNSIKEKDNIIFEKYNSKFEFVEKGTVKAELPIFGGFYSGKKYNFIIFGQENSKESDKKEVIRVVKYSKEMKKLDSISIFGDNTGLPFYGGSPSIDESNGILYIHSCYRMYKDKTDGQKHQASKDYFIKVSDMSFIKPTNNVNRISHSFNQFIKIKDDCIYTVDHGDASPRAVVAQMVSISGKEKFKTNLLNIKGKSGDNYTGVTVGGMELSDSHMIVSGSSIPQDDNWSKHKQKNVYIATVNLKTEKTSIKYLTKYKETDNIVISNPKLVKIDNKNFMAMWSQYDLNNSKYKLCIAMLDGNGNKVGKTKTFSSKSSLLMSDCQPIIYNNQVVFYTTGVIDKVEKEYIDIKSFGTTPTFYFFNTDGDFKAQSEEYNKNK